ncbi:MAG: ATP-binding protein [Desulfurococcales archaeon]|nr:ATP-binding protein [Desulfurococcales archaeon]
MSSPPTLGKVLRLRGEVLEGRIEPAVSLARVASGVLYGEDTGWQGRPGDFLERTYITRAMRRVLLAALARLSGRTALRLGDELVRPASVVLLPSMLGGGKTHLMAFLLHVVSLARQGGLGVLAAHDPLLAEALRGVEGRLAGVGIAVVVGDQSRFAPTDTTPAEVSGVRVETIWDLIAAQLGSGAEPLGWREAPSVDYIRDRILANRPVLIVIDEIVSYLARLEEPRRDQVVTFLRNLFQAVDESPTAVVVLSLPGEPSTQGDLGVVEHDATVQGRSAVRDIYNNARRVYPLIVQPLDMKTDIVMVLRKRLLGNNMEELEDAGARAAGLIRQMLGDSAYLKAVREVFGTEAGFLDQVKASYPFHPLFIKTLLDLGSVIRGFRRTRGLLEIAMDVLLDMRDTDSLDRQVLVMPWNLRVEREDLRAKILADHPRLDYYNKVLVSDLETATSLLGDEPERLEAARRVIRTVWLYSVGLGTLANVKMMIEKAPRVEALPAYVLEPSDAGSRITAGYIVTVARDLAEVPKFELVHYEGKVLYPLLPDVNKIIMQRYESAEPARLYEDLSKYLSKAGDNRGGFKQVVVITSKHRDMQEARSRIARIEDPALTIYADISVDLHVDEEAQLLPRNNTALLKTEPWARVEESRIAMDIAEVIARDYPYTRRPGTLIDLVREIYRLLDAIEGAKDEIELTHDKDTAAIAAAKLGEAENRLRRQALASLALLFTKLKAGAEGKVEYSFEPRSGPEPGSGLATLAERAWSILYSRGLAELDWPTLVDVLRVLGKVGRREGLEGEDVITEPVPLTDIWQTLLRSRDERVPVHVLDKPRFIAGLVNAYRYNHGKVAFLGEDGRVYWIKPQEVDSIEEGSIDPALLADLEMGYQYSEAELRGILAPGGSLRGSLVHPLLVVDRLIQSLLEEQGKPLKRGDVEVYRKYYLVDRDMRAVEELDRFYTMHRGNEMMLYKGLLRSYIVYTEHVVEKTYEISLVDPAGDEELRYKSGASGTLTLRVRASSSDYPHKIEVWAVLRGPDGGLVARDEKVVNPSGVRSFTDEAVLELPIPVDPGEYVIEVYARGHYPGDQYERKVKTLKLVKEGYTCTRKTIPHTSLGALTPQDATIRLEGLLIEARPGVRPQQLQANYNALTSIARRLEAAEPSYNATLSASSGDFKISLTLRNARMQELMKTLRTLIDVAAAAGARVEEVRIEAILHDKDKISPEDLASGLKDTPIQGNTLTISLTLTECRQV